LGSAAAAIGATTVSAVICYDSYYGTKRMIEKMKNEKKCCSLIRLAFIYASRGFMISVLLIFFAIGAVVCAMISYDMFYDENILSQLMNYYVKRIN
jgi:hypothetical protein